MNLRTKIFPNLAISFFFFLFFFAPKSKLLMKKKINWDSKTKHPKKLNMVGLLDQKKISFHSFLFQLFNMINFNVCSDKLNMNFFFF